MRLHWSRVLSALLLVLFLVPSFASADIRRLEIGGGWYGENLPRPGAEYAVAVPSQNKLVSSAGDIAFGFEPPLYVRITNAGGFKLAGQGHETGRTVEWGGGFWNTRPVACGVSPLIYDLFGVLHLSDCSIGSQGWRYVEDGTGRLVTGDETYVSGPPLNLYEYTRHGDITIGQGAKEGCIAVRGSERRMLEPGYCVFARFNRAGDELAVTMVKLLEGKTVLLWMNAADLSSFPPEPPEPVPMPIPLPPVPPAPTPTPTPQVNCGEVPTSGQAVLRTLWARPDVNALVRGDDDQRRQAVRMFAEQLAFTVGPAWGTKDAGGGRPPSKDAVATHVNGALCGWDVISGSTRELSFGRGEELPGQHFIAVTPTNHVGGATGAGGTSADPRIADLEKKLADLQAEFVRVHTNDWSQIETLQKRQGELEAERDDLKTQILTLQAERDRARQELDAERAKPASCEAVVPAIVKRLGIKVGCRVTR